MGKLWPAAAMSVSEVKILAECRGRPWMSVPWMRGCTWRIKIVWDRIVCTNGFCGYASWLGYNFWHERTFLSRLFRPQWVWEWEWQWECIAYSTVKRSLSFGRFNQQITRPCLRLPTILLTWSGLVCPVPAWHWNWIRFDSIGSGIEIGISCSCWVSVW